MITRQFLAVVLTGPWQVGKTAGRSAFFSAFSAATARDTFLLLLNPDSCLLNSLLYLYLLSIKPGS